MGTAPPVGEEPLVHYRCVSGDSHMEVDTANWTPRVPDQYRANAPELRRIDGGMDAWFIEGRQVRLANAADLYGGKGRENYLPRGATYEGTPGTGSPAQRLQEQDLDGVDAEVLFPAQSTGPKMWRQVADDAAYKSMVRAYNDWLIEDYCSHAPDRLIGVALMPLVDDVVGLTFTYFANPDPNSAPKPPTGLGNCIAEALFDIGTTIPHLRLGVENYAPSGPSDEVYRHCGLDTDSIKERVQAFALERQ